MERWTQEEKQHLLRLFEITFDRIRAGESPPYSSDGDLTTKHPGYALDLLEGYQSDQSFRVRRAAYRYAYQIGRSTGDSAIRKRVVLQLAKAVRDAEPAGGPIEARWLLSFRKHEFTSEACDMLRAAAVKEPIRQDVLLVLGVAGMNEMDSWLKKISENYFNAVLALARLGDDEAARQAVERANKVIAERDKDRGSWTRIYLKKLGYTRHRIALKYIAGYLNLDSDEGKVTLREGGDYALPSYACEALDALGKYYAGFPIKDRKTFHCSNEELATAREWVKKRLEETQR
jgi:hypothetical protein